MAEQQTCYGEVDNHGIVQVGPPDHPITSHITQEDGMSQTTSEISSNAVKPRINVRASSYTSTPRLSFRGSPGQDGYKRLVMIVAAMVTCPPNKLFGSKKDKKNVHRDVTDALNQDPLFDGCLKESTTREKFQDAVKEANSIIQNGEEGHIKRAQNGGDAMSELDELYLQLSRIKRRWEQKCDQERALANAEEEDTNTRFQAVMNTVQKRVSMNAPQFNYVRGYTVNSQWSTMFIFQCL